MEVDFLMDDKPVKVLLERKQGTEWSVQVGEKTLTLDYARLSSHTASLLVDGRSLTAHVVGIGEKFYVSIGGRRYYLQMPTQDLQDRDAAAGGVTGAADGKIKTPMPGLIVKVLVSPGDDVTAGSTLVILEAMKMENAVKAPCDAVVKAVNVAEGDQTNPGDVLVEIEAVGE